MQPSEQRKHLERRLESTPGYAAGVLEQAAANVRFRNKLEKARMHLANYGVSISMVSASRFRPPCSATSYGVARYR